MLTVITVYFEARNTILPTSIGVFHPGWVDLLARGVKRHLSVPYRFVCLTEEPQSSFAEDVEAVRFKWDCRDWMCINEVFRPDLGIEHGFFLGLDTVLMGSLDDLVTYEGPLGLTRCPIRKNELNNAIAIWKGTEVHKLWNLYYENPRYVREISTPSLKRGMGGPRFPSEMVFWRENFGLTDRLPGEVDSGGRMNPNIDVLTDLFPGQITSFRCEYRPGHCTLAENYKAPLDKSNVRVVYFHGRPKPHHLKDDHPVKIAWRQS